MDVLLFENVRLKPLQKTALLGRGAFAPYKRFSEGKTLAQGQFTCPEHVKSRRVEPPVRRRNQKRRTRFCVSFFFGAGDEARTRYLHLGKVALYQMSYTCMPGTILCGSPCI